MTTLATGPGTPLEKPSVFTTLGIQFWDFALEKPVDSDLEVNAWIADSYYPPTPAFRTGSGNYAFLALPGLHDVEYPVAGRAPASPPRVFSFVITVEDRLRRFLPALFGVDLPLPYRGLFLSNVSGSPADVEGRAYLFSAPTRAVGVGMSAVRVTVWDKDATPPGPAAFAAVRVSINGQFWTGIADDQGRALIAFPSPLVQRLSLGSPPGSGQGSPAGMTWPISVQIFYQPNHLRYLLENTPDVPWPWNITPTLKSILDEQAPALIWQTEAGPPVPDWTGTLTYGEELVLRTQLTDPAALSAALLISQSTTSP
jgi:hypothetical protein